MEFRQQPGRGTIRVLLVEDHPVNQKVVSRMLDRLGCVVDVAEDGLAGVERAAACPSLILMDCSMPRCDGYEATGRIRALPGAAARTAIVALSAHASADDKARCLASGMDDWLSKPVAPEDLRGMLEKYTQWTSPPPPLAVEEILDARVLRQLLDLGTDDAAFFGGVVGDFRSAAEGLVAEARAHLARADAPAMRRVALRLHEAALAVGAVRVQAACATGVPADDAELLAKGAAWVVLVAQEVSLAVTTLVAAPRAAR